MLAVKLRRVLVGAGHRQQGIGGGVVPHDAVVLGHELGHTGQVALVAEPAHDDAWGGTDFTFGDVTLRKPKGETHELMGKETFNDCLGHIAFADAYVKWWRTDAYYDSGAWRGTWDGEGGGILINQAPHSLDLFQWIGGMPKRVVGMVHTRAHDIEVEDTASASIRSPSVGSRKPGRDATRRC